MTQFASNKIFIYYLIITAKLHRYAETKPFESFKDNNFSKNIHVIQTFFHNSKQ